MKQGSIMRLRLALFFVVAITLLLWNAGTLLAAGEQLRGAILSGGGVVNGGDGMQLRGMAGAIVDGTSGSSSAELCSGFACGVAGSDSPDGPDDPDEPDNPSVKMFMPMIQTNE